MKKSLALALAFVVAVGLCACGAGGDDSSPPYATSRPEGGRYKLCASYPGLNDSYYSLLNAAVKTYVAENDDRVVLLDAGFDALTQAEQILDMHTEEGIDVLLVAPMDEKVLAPVLSQLDEAGVPVISMCLPLADTTVVDHMVLSNFSQGGALCAENAGQLLPEGSSYVVLEQPGQGFDSEATTGWDGGLRALEGEWTEAGRWDSQGNEERSYNIITGFLEESKQVGAIFCSCDEAAIGAVRAVQDAGFDPGEVLVYAVGGSPAARKLVAAEYLSGLATQRPTAIGNDAVSLAYRILEGRSTDGNVQVATALITPENIGSYRTDIWE